MADRPRTLFLLLSCFLVSGAWGECGSTSPSNDSGADDSKAVGARIYAIVGDTLQVKDLVSVTPDDLASGTTELSPNIKTRGELTGLDSASDIVVAGSTAFLASQLGPKESCNSGGCEVDYSDLRGFVLAADVSDPNAPVAGDRLELPGPDAPTRLRLLDNQVYVLQGGLGITAFAADGPMPPTSVASFSLPADELGNPIVMRDIASDGDHLFVASDHGLYVLSRQGDTFTVVGNDDASDLDSCAVAPNAPGTLVCASRATRGTSPPVAAGNHRLMLYDVSSPSSPQLVFASEQKNSTEMGVDIAVWSTTAVLLQYAIGATTWNFAADADPAQIGSLDFTEPQRVRLWKSWAFIADAGDDGGTGSQIAAVDLSGEVSDLSTIRISAADRTWSVFVTDAN